MERTHRRARPTRKALRRSSGNRPNRRPLRLERYRQSTIAFSGEAIRNESRSLYQSNPPKYSGGRPAPQASGDFGHGAAGGEAGMC